jgi:hypothetical protein
MRINDPGFRPDQHRFICPKFNSICLFDRDIAVLIHIWHQIINSDIWALRQKPKTKNQKRKTNGEHMKIVAAAIDSWANNRLDILGIGSGNAMFHKSWSNGSWAPSQTDWEAIGGLFISAPALVSWGSGRLDVFAVGMDNAMYHKSWPNGAWSPSQTGWESLGGSFISSPVAVSWGADRLDVFGIGTDNAMFHKSWSNGAWGPSQTGWEALGGTFLSAPAVASWAANRLDVFGVGSDFGMYHKSWSSGAWFPPTEEVWDSLGGAFNGAPAVVSWGSGRLDIFALGFDNAVNHKAWSDNDWDPLADWEVLGGTFTSPPVAVSWAANRLDIFGIGADNSVYHKSWSNGAWGPSQNDWESLGGTLSSAPAVASWAANRLDIVGIGSNDAMFHKSWNSGAWDPSQTDWESLGGTFVLPVMKPVPVPLPPNGLVSNSNYLLGDNGQPLLGVSVTIAINEVFASTNNGYSFQLNCYSPKGSSTEWQQFVIWSSGGDVYGRIDTWSGTSKSDELNRIDGSLVSFPGSTIYNGFSLKITLVYEAGSYNVSGAVFTAIDNAGIVINSVEVTILGQNLRTTGQPATVSNLAPIVALQFNIGGDNGGNAASLLEGAGTITYSSTNPLAFIKKYPSYVSFDDGTLETANLTFGPIPGTVSQVITQSFQAITGAQAPKLPVVVGGHPLPPPDALSLASKSKRS